ncbi:MAG: sensor histidine kinase [Syntrophobacterales bacterium]|nr:sensor histidine kinase [Syntrophobacterales bacterium]
MEILLSLTQEMAVFVVIAYIYSKSPLFKSLTTAPIRGRDRIYLYLVFSALSVMGTYLGVPVQDAIANTRAIGPVLAGLLGGPVLGLAVGFTGGLHRFLLGGFTAFSCGLSTTIEGGIGGIVHLYLYRKNHSGQTLNPKIAFMTAFGAEITQMIIILLVSRPYANAVALVQVIALPMILSNAIGAALFVNILRDQRNMLDRIAASSYEKAFKIAERSLNILAGGINDASSVELARIIHEETGVGSVAITDREKVIAFTGHGSDHHRPGDPIATHFTKKAINENKVVFADGVTQRYRCSLSGECPLHSVLVVPLHIDNDVIGTIQLFETKDKKFLNMNKTLGEGITRLLSNQLLLARYELQKRLLVQSELKLLQAQVNPHFLFNALNTIIAILRIDSSRCKELLIHLSNFFRKNLKRASDLSTLEEELDQVNSYLQIEKARFDDRLTIEIDIDPALLQVILPTFTLQPLVENAFKHGISNTIGQGIARIRAFRRNGRAIIEIEDNAGIFPEQKTGDGYGIKIVDKRLKCQFGDDAGVSISCEPDKFTRATVMLPLETKTS